MHAILGRVIAELAAQLAQDKDIINTILDETSGPLGTSVPDGESPGYPDM